MKLGKYDIVDELGRGAMGVVYKGFDPSLERFVAIKTIRTDLLREEDDASMQLARFKREAQAAGRINHPNIVAIYEYGEADGTTFIAMEFVEGRSLKDYLDAQERFTIPRIVTMMTSLLSALQYSHDKGVVHRDIKPANIMVTKEGAIKVTDFGIARLESSTLTQAGMALGTPSYMSPEQFMGQTVDARSDIYSAGVVLYQLLTGEKPFTGAVTTIMHRALNSMPDRPSVLNVQVPAAFDDVIAKSMAKRPEGRYQTAQEFADDLIAVANGKPSRPAPSSAIDDDDATIVASPAPPLPRTPLQDAEATRVVPPPAQRESPQPESPGKSRTAVIAAAAALLLAVAGVVGWQLSTRIPARIPEPSATVTPLPEPPKPVAAIPPAPLPAPVEPYGLLRVNSNPISAVVQLRDGSFLGITPNDIRLKPGAHDIVVKKAGYHDLESTIEIEPGEEIEFDADLVRMQ
jgi:eukaryotic-like serine/threonine-protein kinase